MFRLLLFSASFLFIACDDEIPGPVTKESDILPGHPDLNSPEITDERRDPPLVPKAPTLTEE